MLFEWLSAFEAEMAQLQVSVVSWVAALEVLRVKVRHPFLCVAGPVVAFSWSGSGFPGSRAAILVVQC